MVRKLLNQFLVERLRIKNAASLHLRRIRFGTLVRRRTRPEARVGRVLEEVRLGVGVGVLRHRPLGEGPKDTIE